MWIIPLTRHHLAIIPWGGRDEGMGDMGGRGTGEGRDNFYGGDGVVDLKIR